MFNIVIGGEIGTMILNGSQWMSFEYFVQFSNGFINVKNSNQCSEDVSGELCEILDQYRSLKH